MNFVAAQGQRLSEVLCLSPDPQFDLIFVVMLQTLKNKFPIARSEIHFQGLGEFCDFKIVKRVVMDFLWLGSVSHLWFGFEFGKFPLFPIFFPSGQKNLFGSCRKVPGSKAGWPLIYCRSKVSSGRVG